MAGRSDAKLDMEYRNPELGTQSPLLCAVADESRWEVFD
jgi:hypothetical protein